MDISVVIPTRNRKERLLSLLNNLSKSSFSIKEIIIVDASDEQMQPSEYSTSAGSSIFYIPSESSVCMQRNIGIKAASSSWIFVCDDDIEVPIDYLAKIAAHISKHPEAGAVSGLVLQRQDENWVDNYAITSSKELLLRYIFKLGVWGEVKCRQSNFLVRKLTDYYQRKGNHISKAGWPVITDFSGTYFTVPVYGLGASVIRRDWLIASPYDETLDKHGIGDNYGVAAGFPAMQVQVLKDAFVYHHQEPANRLQKPLQYYRRALALDYFTRRAKNLQHVRRSWMIWSLLGNVLIYPFSKDKFMFRPALKTLLRIAFRENPYVRAAGRNEKTVEPLL